MHSGQSVLDAAIYHDALCLGVERSITGELRIELEPIQLRPAQEVLLGIILNELVMNCIKYAAEERSDACVRFHSDIGTSEALLRCGTLGLSWARSARAV